MLKPVKVDEANLAYGGDMKKLLPEIKDIPDEFQHHNTSNKWVKIFNDCFFGRKVPTGWYPKEGIDPEIALNHIIAVMRSWEPKHEHKEAGCAYLMSEFFEDVTYN